MSWSAGLAETLVLAGDRLGLGRNPPPLRLALNFAKSAGALAWMLAPRPSPSGA